MSVILLTLTICLANVIVDVETVDGDSYQGDLVSWSDETIGLAVDAQPKGLAIEQVHLVRNRQYDDPVAPPKVWVELHDNSRIAATAVRTEGDRAVIQTASGTVTCPLRAVRTVRWRANDTELDAAWREMLRNDFGGDAIIVRKDSDNLDFLEGTVRSVSETAISFEFDEEVVDLPLDRLAGVILFRPAGEATSPGRFRIDLRDQSSWQGNSIALSDGELLVRSVSGVELSTPVSDLAEIVVATQSLVYVSDLKPEQVTVEPYLKPSIASEAVVAFLYRPLMNQGFAARPLRLQFTDEIEPRQYAKGMALHSKTRLIYRLEEPFRGLRGVIGWDPDFVASGGSVQVHILAGGDAVFDGTWNPDDPPIEIDVPINDAKRLELIVDYSDGSDIGDRINLCNLRLLK